MRRPAQRAASLQHATWAVCSCHRKVGQSISLGLWLALLPVTMWCSPSDGPPAVLASEGRYLCKTGRAAEVRGQGCWLSGGTVGRLAESRVWLQAAKIKRKQKETSSKRTCQRFGTAHFRLMLLNDEPVRNTRDPLRICCVCCL